MALTCTGCKSWDQMISILPAKIELQQLSLTMYKNIHPNLIEENSKINPSKQLMSISQILIMSVSCARKYNGEQETAPALTEPNNGADQFEILATRHSNQRQLLLIVYTMQRNATMTKTRSVILV